MGAGQWGIRKRSSSYYPRGFVQARKPVIPKGEVRAPFPEGPLALIHDVIQLRRCLEREEARR